jgi:hypothetical protein
MYKVIQPEVIVGLGDKTVFVEAVAPFKTVAKLHVELEDWLGDDLMECYPCYLVTEDLKDKLSQSDIKGYVIEPMQLTKNEYFANNYRLEKKLPKFYWLKIVGLKDRGDDMYIGEEKALFASDKLLDFLKKQATIKYMEVDPQKNEFDDLLDQMIADSKKKNNN